MQKRTQRSLLSRTLVVGAATGAFLAASALSLNAQGIILPPPINRVALTPTTYAPGNVIIGLIDCPRGCTLDDLSFVDSFGMVLTGQFIDVSATLGTDLFAWLPDTELAPGTYFVNLPSLTGGAEFTIGVDSPLGLSDVMVTEYRSPAGEAISCVEKEGIIADDRFYESVLIQARIGTQVVGTSKSQHIYDLIVNGEPVDPFADPRTDRVVEGTPSELCYELFARPIIGVDDFLLASDCVPVDPTTLGLHPETSANQGDVLARRVVPPVGYDAEWCATFTAAFEEESCSSFTYRKSCFAARRACPEGDNPPPEAEEEEQMMRTIGSGTGGSASGGIAGDGDGDAMGDGDGVSPGDEGCSCRVGQVGGARGALGSLSLMLLALGGLVLRRRGLSRVNQP